MICVSFFVIVIYEIMNNICAFDIKKYQMHVDFDII